MQGKRIYRAVLTNRLNEQSTISLLERVLESGSPYYFIYQGRTLLSASGDIVFATQRFFDTIRKHLFLPKQKEPPYETSH